MAAKRPFKITYYRVVAMDWYKVGRMVACSSPEAVVRSCALTLIADRAERADVFLDGDLFATMEQVEGGAIRFDAAVWASAKAVPGRVP